jgi:GR25 family glycosyltransferase involved in LPS biosynthesis
LKAIVINLDERTDRMEQFKKNEFPFEVERFSAFKMESGQDGFTLSTRTLLSQITEFPVLICEDDCVMLENWMVVQRAMAELPDDADALWLGATLTQPLEKYSEYLFRLKRAYTTHAIIYYSKRMVDYILNLNVPSGINLDIFYFLHVQKEFNCFITNPICATQSDGYSDVSGQEMKFYDYIIESYNKFTK